VVLDPDLGHGTATESTSNASGKPREAEPPSGAPVPDRTAAEGHGDCTCTVWDPAPAPGTLPAF